MSSTSATETATATPDAAAAATATVTAKAAAVMPAESLPPGAADGWRALSGWGDALAVLCNGEIEGSQRAGAVDAHDMGAGRITHCNAAMRRLLPQLADTRRLADWLAALPGLAAALAAARQNLQSQAQPCGAEGQLLADVSALDDRHLLLRLRDEGEHQRERLQALQRQLADREGLIFTSRSVSIGEMGSTLAHELNQPIGAAANLLRGLRLRLARRPAGQVAPEELAAVERAIEQVMYAAKVIARIREYTHSRTPKAQAVDVGALMRASVSLLDWDLQRVGVELELALPETPVLVRGDAVMLQQVLVNLLRNALDALREDRPPRPRITLTLLRGEHEAEARVGDNGVGLSTEAEQRLFVPFSSTKPNGMGIGLAICRSFVELHQGRLWFSRGAERGCSFHVGLPLHTA